MTAAQRRVGAAAPRGARLAPAGLALAAALLVPAGIRAQPRAAERAPELVRAEREVRELVRQGRTEIALERLEEAEGTVAARGAEARADLEILRGDVLAGRVRDAGALELDEAIAAYGRAIDVGTRRQKSVARNNVGALHYATGRWDESVEALSAVELDAVDEESAYVYRYNLGRALAAAGRGEEAADAYLDALRRKPSHDASARRLIELLDAERAGERSVDKAITLGRFLLAEGEIAQSRRLLDATLDNWTEPSMWALLPRTYAASPPSCAELPAGAFPGSRRFAELREILCAGPPPAAASAAPSPAPAWSADPETAAALADLLVAAGDERHREGRSDDALDWYVHAVRVDPGHARALRRAAVALAAGAGGEGRATVFEALVGQLDAATRRRLDGPAADDELRDLLAAHQLLASELDALGVPVEDLLRVGLAIQSRLEERGEPPAPGLHLRLAAGQSARGDAQDAAAQYLRAAEGFLALEDLVAAENVVRRVERLTGGISAADPLAERAGRLRERLAAAWTAEGRPSLASATPRVLAGKQVCACGRFPRPEHALLLSIRGADAAAGDAGCPACEVVSADARRVCFALPPSLPPGPYLVAAEPRGGFGRREAERFRVLAVHDEGLTARPDGLVSVAVTIEGTRERVAFEVTNRLPQQASLIGGDVQRARSRGGTPNRLELLMTRLVPEPNVRVSFRPVLPQGACPAPGE